MRHLSRRSAKSAGRSRSSRYMSPAATQELAHDSFEAVQRIYREVTKVYADEEIDWLSIHDAGCTRDDTDLPHHVTSQNDLDRLITGTFRSFLTALPAPPTIVTIARSSEDDYCPPEDVDQIQVAVLEELRQRLGPETETKMAYLERELH